MLTLVDNRIQSNTQLSQTYRYRTLLRSPPSGKYLRNNPTLLSRSAHWTKQDKMHKFLRKSSFFKTMYNTKTNQFTRLLLVRCLWKEEGTRLTSVLGTVSLLPSFFCKDPAGKSELFFVFMLYVALKKRISLKICPFCSVLFNSLALKKNKKIFLNLCKSKYEAI